MERLSLEQYLTQVIWPAFLTTMTVMAWTVLISTVVGFILAVIMDVSKEDGLHPNPLISRVMDFLINLIRSMARLIQGHMDQVSREAIGAAKSFGASTFQIIWHVILVEAIPGISSVICFSAVAALNASTTAGMVGAGGLGNVAIRYGYNNFNDTIMYSTVAILVILVQLIQFIGNKIYNKLK